MAGDGREGFLKAVVPQTIEIGPFNGSTSSDEIARWCVGVKATGSITNFLGAGYGTSAGECGFFGVSSRV